MGLFKDVKKPVLRAPAPAAGVSPLRPRFVAKTPPCAERCPSGSDVRGWLTTIAQADAYGRTRADALELAWRLLVSANPFPATLGRICPHPCESACTRRDKDGAVAVNAMERALGDLAIAGGYRLPAPGASRAQRVAIIGGGPCGLSAAVFLAGLGYRVVVFEAKPAAGGRLRDGLRTGRLPEPVLEAELARVTDLGVDVRGGVAIELPGGLDALRAQYDAVLLAIGRAKAAAESGGSADAASRVAEMASVVLGGDESRTPGGERGTGPAPVFAAGDAVATGLVAAAVGRGREAAEAIHACLSGEPVAPRQREAVIATDRIKLAWYPAAPRAEWAGGDPARSEPPSEEALTAEAARCLSCGLCMDCETCWMYCTSNCFERLPKGEHYRVKIELCNGCKKCGDACPCGYIELA